MVFLSSNQTMIQIILGVVIVSIGIFVFYKYPMKSDVRQMTLGALFVILAIILKRLAVMVPFLGFPSLKIYIRGITFNRCWFNITTRVLFYSFYRHRFSRSCSSKCWRISIFRIYFNAVLQTEIPCLLRFI